VVAAVHPQRAPERLGALAHRSLLLKGWCGIPSHDLP
jgi:hypothetical protein